MTDESNQSKPPPSGNVENEPRVPPPAAQDAAAPASAADAAETTIATLTAERDRLKDQLLRSLADQDNFRKRSRRETEEATRKAREDTLRELLPVFDNLERATQYFGSATDLNAVAKGVEMVLRLFEDTLGRLGGKRLRAVGLPFDPSEHEAIQQVESAEYPAGVVAREEGPGYRLGDRLLRPAMVVVSKGTGQAGPPPSDGGSAASS